MLMRYAQHLAQGQGIVWNIGEKPVDGATDFLFMVVSALLIKLGLTVGQAVRGVGFLSHLATVLIVYWTNRRVHQADIFSSLLSGLYLAVGTGFSYVAAYFGTPFFALAAASTWTLGLLLIKWHRPERTQSEGEVVVEGPPLWLSMAFAFSALATGLIRPEGVILASLMLISIVYSRGFKNAVSIIVVFAVTFLLLGGSYFVWRWDYFGYPLPNPFYKKGGSVLHWNSLLNSLLHTLRLCLPFFVTFILAFRSHSTARLAIALLIPALGFASAFILISDEMDFGARFQYALVPLVLMSWPPLAGDLNFTWLARFQRREKIAYVAALTAAAAGVIYYSSFQNCFLTDYQQSCDRPYERDGRYEMGKILSAYRDKGYTIATSEAGLVPYYSGWNAVDTWGLNDQWIAHHGGLTPEYLDRYEPEIIMFHAYYSPLVPPEITEASLSDEWFSMTITLKTYAEENGYILAAVFGDSPYDTNYFYVRPDFPDSQDLIEQISTTRRYFWFITGNRSINYAPYGKP